MVRKLFLLLRKKAFYLHLKNDVLNYECLAALFNLSICSRTRYDVQRESISLNLDIILQKKSVHQWKSNSIGRHHFNQFKNQKHDFIKEIKDVLFDSVKMHMRSDVPVGSFLSGGIDSSIIASIAKEFHPAIKTFSVGFEQNGFSEIDVAKETAEKLGVENISYVITPEEYMNEVPKIMWHMDDPFADPACVPLYFVAREARNM